MAETRESHLHKKASSHDLSGSLLQTVGPWGRGEEEKQLNTGIWRQTGEWSCFRLTSSNHCLFCLYGDRGKRLSLVLDERVFQSVQTGANKVKAYYSAGCSFKRYTSMSLCHTASKMMQFRVHSKEHISSFRCGFYGVPNISIHPFQPWPDQTDTRGGKRGTFSPLLIVAIGHWWSVCERVVAARLHPAERPRDGKKKSNPKDIRDRERLGQSSDSSFAINSGAEKGSRSISCLPKREGHKDHIVLASIYAWPNLHPDLSAGS